MLLPSKMADFQCKKILNIFELRQFSKKGAEHPGLVWQPVWDSQLMSTEDRTSPDALWRLGYIKSLA